MTAGIMVKYGLLTFIHFSLDSGGHVDGPSYGRAPTAWEMKIDLPGMWESKTIIRQVMLSGLPETELTRHRQVT